MIRNLLMVALRNFKKDKYYSLLNVIGLTIGITFSLLLIFYVIDELSYDKYHAKADRIYRIVSYIKEPENSMKWSFTQFPLGPTLKREYPEVEQAARFVGGDRTMFKNGDRKFYENKIFYADSNLFEIFTYRFLEGNPATALVSPHSIVLTKSLAVKYFGQATPVVGQSLQNNQGEVFKITGVMEDVPKNSHITFNGLMSISTLPKDFSDNWGSFGFFTYVLLKPNVDAAAFEKKLGPMYEKYMAPVFAQLNIKIRYGVQPITAIHLHSDFTGEPEELGSMSYIYIFSSVALFMLIIACINYMNLTTARSARRAKEIGIRKVAGSTQGQLVAQFLTESVALTVVSLLLSLGLLYLLLPVFNTLSGKSLTLSSLLKPATVAIIVGIILFVGILGGSYPAFYLARFNPVSVLKGSLSKSSSNLVLRKVLVVTQFSISMIMLICTAVVYGQLKYMKTKDLGFNKDQVVSLNVDANRDADSRSKVLAFKNLARQNPNVLSASTASSVPGSQNVNFNLFSVETGKGYVDKGIDCYVVDEDYFKTLGIQVIKGRNFSGIGDTLHSIVVNESMVKEFGWGNDAIGKRVKFPGDTTGNYLEVIGVARDFHQKSLYNPIAPLLLFYQPNINGIQLKLAAQDIPKTLGSLENSWKSVFPSLPFQYTFLDRDFNSQYAADQKRGEIFTSFSTLTILITCLGLLGLIAFSTQQRQKEIGIRKVMGASLADIISLIAKNFVVLVGISCLIAFPVAYYFMHRWLSVFPYKEGLQASTFILSAVVVLAIALLTVSFHTVKVALANPVDSLRTE